MRFQRPDFSTWKEKPSGDGWLISVIGHAHGEFGDAELAWGHLYGLICSLVPEIITFWLN
ncbi:MAG: hypothetical protein RBR35_15440 [Salinivirgaceae bacterium]|nr:hypothetical protein [Salinivirgaceae bacterium]